MALCIFGGGWRDKGGLTKVKGGGREGNRMMFMKFFGGEPGVKNREREWIKTVDSAITC